MIQAMSKHDTISGGFELLQDAIMTTTRQVVAIVNKEDLTVVEYGAIKGAIQGLAETVIAISSQTVASECERQAGQTASGNIHEQGEELFWRPNKDPKDPSKNGTSE